MAEKACEDLGIDLIKRDNSIGIKSQNDTQKLEEAKPIVQQEMIDADQAFLYYEPNGLVVSRSGDECVVTFSDQWYITYGEKDWKPLIADYIHNKLETYNPKTKQSLEASCEWLSYWACSRQFGLGTSVCIFIIIIIISFHGMNNS